jgi:hypothetical protein
MISWFVYEWTNPNYEKCFRQNSTEFTEHRKQFEKIVKDVSLQYLKGQGKIKFTTLSKKVTAEYQEELDEIGIESLEISSNTTLNCYEKATFLFSVKSGYNISKLRNVQIIYSPCNPQTEKNFHQNSGHIDVNGEGHDWLIFSDTDFI